MTGHVSNSRAQFEAFKALPRDTPLNMLNLIRLRDKADYPDGRAATGAEAYAAYGRESGPIFAREKPRAQCGWHRFGGKAIHAQACL